MMDMVLTGRTVDAREAYAIGLANRGVPKGKALEEAARLAESLLGFPQVYMNVDRAGCYYAAYETASFEDALRSELETGVGIISTESLKATTGFSRGAGRHGSCGE
jgi:enoyl-CoA hydratase/carnithine racemase